MFLDRGSALHVERGLKRSKYDKRNWVARVKRLGVLKKQYGIGP